MVMKKDKKTTSVPMFFLSSQFWQTPYILQGEEARHAMRVLRLRVGDELGLLDGNGCEGRFKITSFNKDSLELELISQHTQPEPENKLILALAWTKAVRRGWILEKAVEFAASEIWFWQAKRSQFPMPSDLSVAWQGQLIAGAKQCHNPWLPKIQTFNNLSEVLIASQTFEQRYAMLEADYEPAGVLKPQDLALPGISMYLIGPEGGFDFDEVGQIKTNKLSCLSLGQRILRYESAAMLCMGLHWWKSEQ